MVMKNKFLVYFIVCLIYLASFSENVIYAENANVLTFEDYEKLILLQQNAVKANEILNQSMGFDEVGNIIFPDELAGVWIDGEILVISLTDTNEKVKEKYINWLGDYSKYIKFEKAQYSYNYLQSSANTIIDRLLAENQINITGYYVSEIENEIVIKASEELSSCVVSYDMDSYEFDVPVRFENATPIQTLSTTLDAGSQLCNATLTLPNDEEDTCMSIGACGAYRSQPAILTCGHRNQVIGDEIKYLSRTGNTIGNITYLRWNNNQYGDFSFVTINDTTQFSISNNIATGDEITGTLSNPALNTIVKFYGYATGVPGYGIIRERGADISPDGIVLKGMSRIEVQEGAVTYGDSGEPIYQETSSGKKFCGILSAGYFFDGYTVDVYFTPYTYINSAGFIVQTR